MKKLIAMMVGFLSPLTLAGGPPPPEVVVDNVQIPWALAFAPDGRIFFTERPGRLRVINADGLLEASPVLTMIDVVPDFRSVGEGGLMGLEIDPNFATNGYLYIDYTHGTPLKVAVARLIEDGQGTATLDSILLDNIPGNSFHVGGRIKIGPPGDPDPKLWITAGDGQGCIVAQDVNSYAGKILRMNLDGSTPTDNPYGNLVYSYGHRNPQGLAWDSSGQLYATEHGPTGDCGVGQRSWYDEVNIIWSGGNYGWPLCIGACMDKRWIDPIWYSVRPNSSPPAGAAFYNGDFYFGMLGTYSFSSPDDYIHARQVHRFTFDQPGGVTIVDEASLYQMQYGRIREVIVGPNGYLYFTTSNRDGRAGAPFVQPDDDKIFRVRL